VGNKKIKGLTLIDAVSTAANIVSTSNNVENYDNIGLQVTYTGTTSGTITVDCSNDDTTYYSLTFSPVLTQPSGTAGGYLIDLNNLPWKYLRVSFADGSGGSAVGTLTVKLFAKDTN